MTDDPINLGFEEASTSYVSGSQSARVWTEQWVHARLFCPNCGAAGIERYPNNQPVADFYCGDCTEDYELKSSKRPFGRSIADGAYATMRARIASPNNPNLILMNYDIARFGVTDLFFIPKQFLVQEIIRERPPLKPSARRAGWVGCNIIIGDLPEAARIHFVRQGQMVPRADVLERWRSTLFMRDQALASRGWLIDVMKCVEAIGETVFSLDDVYAFEERLGRAHPGNNNIRPKIRQQLQVLRDQGYLNFVGRGRYRLRVSG